MKRVTICFVLFFCLNSLHCLQSVAQAGVDIPSRKTLHLLERGETPPRLISWTKHRLAVFSYEDKTGTGVGNDIAVLIAREILFNSNIHSLGVITYQEDLSPGHENRLSYFDKVEKLTEHEGVLIAVWGTVFPVHNALEIDTYVQIFPKALEDNFLWKIRLPYAMGGGVLQAHLRPDRFPIQRLILSRDAVSEIASSAQELMRMRTAPRKDAPVVAILPREKVYSVVRRQGDWVLLRLNNGLEGWTPTKTDNNDSCKRLLEAGTFVGGLLRYAATGNLRSATDNLTKEALAVEEQIKALDALNSPNWVDIQIECLQRVMRWIGPNRWTGIDKWTKIDRGKGPPPGGSAFANINALAEIAVGLTLAHEAMLQQSDQVLPVDERGGNERSWDKYETIVLLRSNVRKITEELVEASLADPANLDILVNLGVLFGFLGDWNRQEIARSLVDQILLNK